jgi:hypothetical protein
MFSRLVVLVMTRNASKGRSLSIDSTCRVSSSPRCVTRDKRAHERGAAQKCLTKICQSISRGLVFRVTTSLIDPNEGCVTETVVHALLERGPMMWLCMKLALAPHT